jgi:hypothetical protein
MFGCYSEEQFLRMGFATRYERVAQRGRHPAQGPVKMGTLNLKASQTSIPEAAVKDCRIEASRGAFFHKSHPNPLQEGLSM